MKRSIIKIISSFVFLVVIAGAMGNTNHEGWLTAWFIMFIFLGIPIFILSWIDLGHSLREIENPAFFTKLLIVIFAVPQAMFGLVSFVIGVSIIGWVLYNTFIETLPQYRGGILTFGVAPALVLFGVYWLRAAFIREQRENEDKSV